WIFTAFAGVALAPDAIHGNGQRFVSFLADRTVRHRTRLETLDDCFDRFNFVNRNGIAGRPEFHQTTQRTQFTRLIVHAIAVLLECRVVTGTTRILKFMNGPGIELVEFALAPVLILTTSVEHLAIQRSLRVGKTVTLSDLFGNYVKSN